MDPSLLEPDELKIECELRNIRGLQSVQLSMLKLSLESESKGEEDEPNVAHSAAQKNPKREVTLCAKKLVEIQESLVEYLKSDSSHKHLILAAMTTRVRHYHSRLIRISSSPSVVNEHPPTFKLCEELLTLLDETDLRNTNLDESIQNIENLENTLAKSFINVEETDEKSRAIETVSSIGPTPTQTVISTSAQLNNSDPLLVNLNSLISSGIFNVSPEMIKQVQSSLQNAIHNSSASSQINPNNQCLNLAQSLTEPNVNNPPVPHCSKVMLSPSNNIVAITSSHLQNVSNNPPSEIPVSSNGPAPENRLDSQNVPINPQLMNQLTSYLSSLNPSISVSKVISPPSAMVSQLSGIPLVSQPPTTIHTSPSNIPTSLLDINQLIKFPPPIMSARSQPSLPPVASQVPNVNLANNAAAIDQLRTLLSQNQSKSGIK